MKDTLHPFRHTGHMLPAPISLQTNQHFVGDMGNIVLVAFTFLDLFAGTKSMLDWPGIPYTFVNRPLGWQVNMLTTVTSHCTTTSLCPHTVQ